MSNLLKTVKVSYLGLDNAGKTTIIRFLEDKLTLDTKPTIKAKISSQISTLAGLEINFWDFGGQEQFRSTYLEDKPRYFTNISAIIYLIDVRDSPRFDQALSYLEDVLKATKEFSDDAKVFIFFHKFDEKVMKEENLEERVKDLKKRIINLNIFDTISFYNTSIFNIISILRAFSDISISLSGRPQLIQNILREYCKKTASSAALLFDTRLFIVDEIAAQKAYVKTMEYMAQTYALSIESLETFSIETIDNVSKIKFPTSDSNDDIGYVFIKIVNLDPRLYLLVMSKNPKTRELVLKYLDATVKKLKELLSE